MLISVHIRFISAVGYFDFRKYYLVVVWLVVKREKWLTQSSSAQIYTQFLDV